MPVLLNLSAPRLQDVGSQRGDRVTERRVLPTRYKATLIESIHVVPISFEEWLPVQRQFLRLGECVANLIEFVADVLKGLVVGKSRFVHVVGRYQLSVQREEWIAVAPL
jgi:hypothetical protein